MWNGEYVFLSMETLNLVLHRIIGNPLKAKSGLRKIFGEANVSQLG